MYAGAAQRPCGERPRGQGKPEQVFQVIEQAEGRLKITQAAKCAERVVVQPEGKEFGQGFGGMRIN